MTCQPTELDPNQTYVFNVSERKDSFQNFRSNWAPQVLAIATGCCVIFEPLTGRVSKRGSGPQSSLLTMALILSNCSAPPSHS